jgi:hypothetical protein
MWNFVVGVRSAAGMTGRDDDRLDADRAGAFVLDGDLGLAVRTQEIELALAPGLGEPLHQAVGQRQRQRHELLGLPHRVAEHHSLVARAARVDALRDVGGLRVDRGDDRARLVVEPELGARVADLLDRLPHDRRQVDVRLRRNLARDEGDAGGDQGLAGDASGRIVAENGVEDGVGDLVGDLVGVPFRHGFRREEVASVLEHGVDSLRTGRVVAASVSGCSAGPR